MTDRINVMTVNNRQVKGIILTAQSILDLKSLADQIAEIDFNAGVGAKNVVDNLEKLYRMIG